MKTKKKTLYEVMNGRYFRYKNVKHGHMTIKECTFHHKEFKTLEKCLEEASRFAGGIGMSSAIIEMPNGRFTFCPKSIACDSEIARMCRIFGAKYVDDVICLR